MRGGPARGRTTRRSALRRASSRSVSWKYTWTSSGRSRRGSARARSPSECVVGIAASVRPDGSSTHCRRGERRPALALARGTEVGAPEACNRRSRARHRPRRPRRRCTSPRRRTASASDRALASVLPRRERARPCRRRLAAHDPAPSSARGGRAGPSDAAWRARSSQNVSSSPNAVSAGRMSAAIAKPPGRRRCSATKRAHTASSSGRSTWQDTTAYRSRDVAPIVLEAR